MSLCFINIIIKIINFYVSIDNNKVVYLPVDHYFKGNVKSLLDEWIKKDTYKHVFLCKDKNLSLDIKYKNVKILNFGVFFIYHYATAKYIIRESGFNSIGLTVRNGAVVVQLWHAAGAFKKFGFDVHSNSFFFKWQRGRDIKKWSMLLCSSREIVDIYSKACGEFDKSKIFISGLPRNDHLYDLCSSRELLRDGYNIKYGQKIVLYAPTFRDKSNDFSLFIEFIRYLEKSLPKEYLLAIRLHPKISNNICLDGDFIDLNSCETEEALIISDLLVTDYSSIIFDFSLMEKPMFFYVPDLEDYYGERGFYYDYESFVPGPFSGKKEKLLDFIVKHDCFNDNDRVLSFKKRFNPYFDGKNSARVLNRILELS